MLFLVHILLFLYGLLAVVVGKIRTTKAFDFAPARILELVEQFFPSSLYQPWQTGTDDLIPDLTRTYVIGGGLASYALYYLHSRHRR